MAQLLDCIPESEKSKLICCYFNGTSSIQVARITNIPNWYFERVVFPGQRLLFEATRGALLEVHTGMMATSILSDSILCESLSVNDTSNEEVNSTESTASYKTTLISAS